MKEGHCRVVSQAWWRAVDEGGPLKGGQSSLVASS